VGAQGYEDLLALPQDLLISLALATHRANVPVLELDKESLRTNGGPIGRECNCSCDFVP
jgi:hypothetical protein